MRVPSATGLSAPSEFCCPSAHDVRSPLWFWRLLRQHPVRQRGLRPISDRILVRPKQVRRFTNRDWVRGVVACIPWFAGAGLGLALVRTSVVYDFVLITFVAPASRGGFSWLADHGWRWCASYYFSLMQNGTELLLGLGAGVLFGLVFSRRWLSCALLYASTFVLGNRWLWERILDPTPHPDDPTLPEFVRAEIELFVLVTASTLFGAWLGSHPAKRRHDQEQSVPRCARCKYDLTSNVSGVCPECGTPIAVGDNILAPSESGQPRGGESE